MVDKSSVLNFLNGYNPDEEDQTTPTVQEQQPVSSGVDSNSVLDFLNTQTGSNIVSINKDSTPELTTSTEEIVTEPSINDRVEELYETDRKRLEEWTYTEENMGNYETAIQEETSERNKLLEQFMASEDLSREEALKVMQEKNPESILLQDPDVEAFKRADKLAAGADRARDSLLAKLNSENFITSGLTEKLLNSGLNIHEINAVVMADDIFNPVTALVNLPQHYREFSEALSEGDFKGAAGSALWATLDLAAAIPGAKLVTGSVKKIAGIGKKPSRIQKARELRQSQRDNPGGARLATMRSISEAQERAADVAAQNRDIADELILQFENTTGKTISVQKGDNLSIDPDLTRKAGLDVAEEITERDGALFGLNLGDDMITSPLLKPEKFNGIVAISSDYKKRFPDDWDTSKTVIDNMLELTVNKKLIPDQELLDELNKYGLSFEDYVLTVVGSASRAGTILGKISQLGRVKPKSIAEADAAKRAAKDAGEFRKFVMRVENVRRGGLVSQIATASRNMMSGGIRAPMESLGNVMDDAIYEASNAGVVAGAKRLVARENWVDSFANMRYMFSRPDLAKGYGDLILEQPQMAKQFDAMYNNINEIQALTGRGGGGAVDKVLSEAEDAVNFLNIPNRWQEYLIRRGQYFGELERIVRREYKIDLVDALNDGKLKDLMNDASSVRPEGAPSFTALVDEAVTKALDVTYAKQPEIPVFRNVSQFIVRNGLTVAIPFPRFMFNSMELMGQYAGGASIPLTRKMSSVVTGGRVGGGPLTAKDRQRITRNMMGIAAVGAGYYMRSADDAPADFEQISVGEDAQMDTTAVYPMAQFLYLGEMTKRKIAGTFEQRFDMEEFTELFTGSNFRTGVGNSVIEEVAQLADATDLTAGETSGRLLGRTFGNWLGTWAVPLGQIIDAERAVGRRGTEFKDVSTDPTLSFTSTIGKEVTRSVKQRGIGVSPDEEAAAPRKEYPFYSEGKERLYPWMKFGGLTITNKPDEEGEYFKRLGFSWKSFGSRSKVPSIKRFEQSMVNGYLPTLTEIAQDQEVRFRKEYNNASSTVQETFTEDEFVTNKLRPLVGTRLRKFKEKIRAGAIAQGDDYAKAMTKYRRVTPDYRRLATTDFVDRYGKSPDPLEAGDLQKLIAIADGYKGAFSQ